MALALTSSRFLDAAVLSPPRVGEGGPLAPFPLSLLRAREEEDGERLVARQQLRNRTMLEGIYSPSITPQEQLLDTLRHVWVLEQQQTPALCRRHPFSKHLTRFSESNDH
jgi:hypothetical protein